MPGKRVPPELSERRATVRSELRRVLREGPLTARDLSARVGLPEKQVAGHLEHLARSLKQGEERLRVEPAQCLDCGFVFAKRHRFSKPSRCPLCRGEHLDPPHFVIVAR